MPTNLFDLAVHKRALIEICDRIRTLADVWKAGRRSGDDGHLEGRVELATQMHQSIGEKLAAYQPTDILGTELDGALQEVTGCHAVLDAPRTAADLAGQMEALERAGDRLRSAASRIEVNQLVDAMAGLLDTPAIDPTLLPKGQEPKKAKRSKKVEARNRWIYQQCKKERQYAAVMRELKRIAPEKGWMPLSSPQGVQQAADRYADRHNLPPLPPRKEC